MGSPSQALSKRSRDSDLMPPPPPPKRQKRPSKVLDEDLYSQSISQIIARDFFPGLVETRAQMEYIQALDSNDNDWIRDAGRSLTAVMTPGPSSRRRGTSFTSRRRLSTGDTPANFSKDTGTQSPAAGRGNDFEPETRTEVDTNMSLGAFQARYTNEDNENFNALLDKQNEQRVAKYAFFHNGNKILAPRQIAHRERERKLLEDRGQQTPMLRTSSIKVNAAGEERAALSLSGPSQDLDARPASLDSFRNRSGPKNSFMFGPDGVEDQATTYAQEAERKSTAPPKAINYAATRMLAGQAEEEEERLMPQSPSISAVDAAISGRARRTASELGYSGADTPRVNGYAFVDADPTLSEPGIPVSDEVAEAAERKAAEKLLPKADDAGPNPFTIHQRSKREDLHMKLVEKNDANRRKGNRLEQLRDLGVTTGKTPVPKFTSSPIIGRKAGELTPAAQSLAAKLATPSRNSSDVFGRKVQTQRNAWTPTPKVKRAA
ncbi:hypothetical protein K431DRAFT_284246 [Polychaeton citri CBS 116435]|uniref:Nuclear protein DGCR14 n=1 Tax=Polychaeton citri CBS 116435 TaxID=1314669 RepID=A0A9P4UQQ1_9PEZI|nr:hypothetical protein K431DRAFT_284246 [Polychaeton citri CBS 116435]